MYVNEAVPLIAFEVVGSAVEKGGHQVIYWRMQARSIVNLFGADVKIDVFVLEIRMS